MRTGETNTPRSVVEKDVTATWRGVSGRMHRVLEREGKRLPRLPQRQRALRGKDGTKAKSGHSETRVGWRVQLPIIAFTLHISIGPVTCLPLQAARARPPR